MSLLAVGTVALDHIETPFASERNVLGGSATFLSLAARFFSDDVRLVAAVGDDFPDDYVEALRRAGVRLDGLDIQEGGKTFSWSGRYHYDFNSRDTLDTQLNVLETFRPVVPEPFRDARIVCLGNLEPSIQGDVLAQMTAPAFSILDTMNFWIEQTPDALSRVLGSVDCLIVNDAEARQLADEPSLIRAASKIRHMGPKTLIIKKGEHGALLFSDNTVFSAPAFPLEDIHDPTGAGDAFMGGFAGYLSRCPAVTPHALRRAVVCGSVIASFSVEAFGPARLLTLTPDELAARVRAYEELSFIPKEES